MNISHLISLITFPCDDHSALAISLRKDLEEAHNKGLSLQAQCPRSLFLPLRWPSIMDSDWEMLPDGFCMWPLGLGLCTLAHDLKGLAFSLRDQMAPGPPSVLEDHMWVLVTRVA